MKHSLTEKRINDGKGENSIFRRKEHRNTRKPLRCEVKDVKRKRKNKKSEREKKADFEVSAPNKSHKKPKDSSPGITIKGKK